MNRNAVVKVIVCCSVLALALGCKPPRPPEVKRIIPVQVYAAQPDSISSYVSLTGGIEAQNDAAVFSRISERLVSLTVRPGDRVSAGQVLGMQYNESALQGKTVATAALRSAEIQLQSRKDDFVRMENLFAKKAVTKQQFDQAKTQYDIAQSTFEQAKATLEQATVQYENGILRAPFDGQVATVNFDINEMVSAGQQVIKIVNANTVKAKLQVPSVDIGKISEGKSVVARFPSIPDTQFTGIVYRMDEAVDPATRTLTVEVRLSNGGSFLKSGLFGEFRIETERRTEVAVVSELTVMARTEIVTDAMGVQTELPEYYVFMVKDGKAVKRVVNTGIVSGGFTELSSGVSFGDSIVVVGQNAVKEGDSLRITNRTEQ